MVVPMMESAKRLRQIGLVLIHGMVYFIAIAGIATFLSYVTGRIFSGTPTVSYVIIFLLLPVLLILVLFSIFPGLLNEQNRRAQEVAFLFSGLIALQSIFQSNSITSQAEDAGARGELTTFIDDIKDITPTSGAICQRDASTGDSNKPDKIVNPACDLIEKARQWDDLDIEFGVAFNLPEQAAKGLQVDFSLKSLEKNRDEIAKSIDEIEKPMRIAKTGRGGRHTTIYYELPQDKVDLALRTNAEYRNAYERLIALEFVIRLYKVQQSDRAAYFWNTGGGLSTLVESVVGWNYKARLLQNFSPFLLR
jgi:hypothetical protein